MKSKTLKVILGVVLIGAALRAALPTVILTAVNHSLNKMEGYEGRIQDIDLHILAGNVRANGIEILKRPADGQKARPFLSASSASLAVIWKEAFKGNFLANVAIDRAKATVTAEKEKAPAKPPQSVEKSWDETRRQLADLLPFKIDRFELTRAEIVYEDPVKLPGLPIFVSNLNVHARNLTNTLKLSKDTFAKIGITGEPMGNSELKINIDANPMAAHPTLTLDGGIKGFQLTQFNPILRNQAGIDLESGLFNLSMELAAKSGVFEGYIKPAFKDVKYVEFGKDIKKPKKLLKESVLGLATELFENKPTDRVLTKIPVSGRFDNPKMDLWASITTLLTNAFVRTLFPGLEGSVNLNTVPTSKEIEKDGKDKKSIKDLVF